MGKTNSQDQSASSESEFSMNASQAEISQPIVQFPYAYGDPYFTGLFTPYGPHTMIQPQVMGPASNRVPLPVELPEDGPIYVNAKQYHGILRRRQIRAKLEAQNKLVRTRKPYLHESRHQHALNRVRGSGGRFLKKSQPSDPHPPTSSQNIPAGSFHFNHNGNIMNPNEHLEAANKQGTNPTAEGTRADPGFQQADSSRFSSIPSHMAGPGGGFVYNGNRHYASIVR